MVRCGHTRLSIKTKLGLLFAGLILIILAMYAATVFVTNKQKADGLVINIAGRQRMLTQKITKELLSYDLALHSGKKVGGLDAAAIRAQAEKTVQLFDNALTSLINGGAVSLTLDPNGSKQATLPPASGKALAQLKQVAELWRQFQGNIDTLFQGKGHDDELNTICMTNVPLLKAMNKGVTILQHNAEAKVRLLKRIQSLLVAGAVALVLIGAWMLNCIVGRLTKAQAFCESFSHGNLTATSDISGRDEIGAIGTSLDEMAVSLRKMIGMITSAGSNLGQSSSHLNELAETFAAASQETSGRSNSVAAAAEEMSANINSVAAATEEASTNISVVTDVTEQMSNRLNEIVGATEKARNITKSAVQEAASASSKVDELGQAAREVGKVTEAITEISEQTNLLALNATIEAARAGEAGKGFAVVANEIKELAKQTAEATGEIKDRINSIQHSTEGTVQQIAQITTIISQVDQIVADIVAAIEEQSNTTLEISENITQATIGIQEVTENVAQIATVSNEVAQDIATVNQDAQATSQGSMDIKASVTQLQQLSTQLQEMTGRFTV